MPTAPTYSAVSAPTSPSYNVVPNPGGYLMNDLNVLFNDMLVYFNGGNVQ